MIKCSLRIFKTDERVSKEENVVYLSLEDLLFLFIYYNLNAGLNTPKRQQTTGYRTLDPGL